MDRMCFPIEKMKKLSSYLGQVTIDHKIHNLVHLPIHSMTLDVGKYTNSMDT